LTAGEWAKEYTYGDGFEYIQQKVPSLPPLVDMYRSSAGPTVYSTGYASLSEYPNLGAIIDAAFFRFAVCDQLDDHDGVFDVAASEEASAAGLGRDRLVCTSLRKSGFLQELYPRYGLQGLLLPFYPLPLFTANWLLLEVSSFTLLLALELVLWFYLQPYISSLVRKYWHERPLDDEAAIDRQSKLARGVRTVVATTRIVLGTLLLFYAVQLGLAWWEVYGELHDNWELPLFHPSAIPVAALLWKGYVVMLAAMFWQSMMDDRSISFIPNAIIFFIVLRHHASGQLLVYMPLLLLDEAVLVFGSFDCLKYLKYLSVFIEGSISYLWAMNWFSDGVDVPLIYYMLYMQNFVNVVVPMSIYKAVFGDKLFTVAFISITVGEQVYSFTSDILAERERRRRIAASPFTSFSSAMGSDEHRSVDGLGSGQLEGDAGSDGEIPQELLDQIERDYFGEDWATLSDSGESSSLLEKAQALVQRKMVDENDEDKERMLERYLCKICLVEASDVVLEPCGHLCMCVECAKRYGQYAASRRSYMRLCPICRAEVTGSKRIFV